MSFTPIEIEGKFEHECSMDKVKFQLTVTPKSCKITCMNCVKSTFYRELKL